MEPVSNICSKATWKRANRSSRTCTGLQTASRTGTDTCYHAQGIKAICQRSFSDWLAGSLTDI